MAGNAEKGHEKGDMILSSDDGDDDRTRQNQTIPNHSMTPAARPGRLAARRPNYGQKIVGRWRKVKPVRKGNCGCRTAVRGKRRGAGEDARPDAGAGREGGLALESGRVPASRSSLKAGWASLAAMRQMRQNAPGAPEGTAGSSMVGGQALRFLAGASGAMGEGGR